MCVLLRPACQSILSESHCTVCLHYNSARAASAQGVEPAHGKHVCLGPDCHRSMTNTPFHKEMALSRLQCTACHPDIYSMPGTGQ